MPADAPQILPDPALRQALREAIQRDWEVTEIDADDLPLGVWIGVESAPVPPDRLRLPSASS